MAQLRSVARYGVLLVLAGALLICASPVTGAEQAKAPGRKLNQLFPGVGTSPGLVNPNRNNCTAGTFFNVTTRPPRCQLCPAGTWSGAKAFACTLCLTKRTCCPGATRPAECVAPEWQCPPVSTCVGPKQPKTAEACPAGTRWAPVAGRCIDCPVGFISKGGGFPCEVCEPPEPKTCCPGSAVCLPRLLPCPRSCPTTGRGIPLPFPLP